MNADTLMRRALWATAGFNALGAAAFMFPDGLGQIAGIPYPTPLLYRASLAFMVALFGATYAWLALQPRLDRPLVAFATFGKAGFFVVVVLCWLRGEAPTLTLATAFGDLAFAALFAWWLVVGDRGRTPQSGASTEARP